MVMFLWRGTLLFEHLVGPLIHSGVVSVWHVGKPLNASRRIYNV